MTEAVVNDLEAIQIDEQNGEEVANPAPAVIDGQLQVTNKGPITSMKTACTTGLRVVRAPTSPRPLPPLTGAAVPS